MSLGIDLENIVYYRDNTHYFVMTAKKQSLLDKGVIISVSIQMWLECMPEAYQGNESVFGFGCAYPVFVLVVGGGARTNSEHHRGTLEQVAKPPNNFKGDIVVKKKKLTLI